MVSVAKCRKLSRQLQIDGGQMIVSLRAITTLPNICQGNDTLEAHSYLIHPKGDLKCAELKKRISFPLQVECEISYSEEVRVGYSAHALDHGG